MLFGEQVADAIGKGWLDDLFDALEREGYACGAAVLPACSVGAPHIRKRLFFGAARMADTGSKPSQRDAREFYPAQAGEYSARELDGTFDERHQYGGATDGMANASSTGLALGECIKRVFGPPPLEPSRQDASYGGNDDDAWIVAASTNYGGWGSADWLGCRDGKFRPVEPGT